MTDVNHYLTLEISETATQAEIKQAYRRLAKKFHPDIQTEQVGHAQIAAINMAYEVLGDPQQRRDYDQQRQTTVRLRQAGFETVDEVRDRTQRSATAQSHYHRQRQSGHDADSQLQQWMGQVYTPVDRLIAKILTPLKQEVRALSADPYDDALMENFQTYLENGRTWLAQAQKKFKSMPNPSNVAGVAANLYYCMNQLEDGLEEMERFTYTYDDSYLHTGQELFRISTQLRKEAKMGMKTAK